MVISSKAYIKASVDKLNSPANTEFSYGPGDFKYKDINGDGKINTEDRTMIGNRPDFYVWRSGAN